MIIEYRDPNLKYNLGKRDEKIRLVLDWLLEFRFSTYEILSERLGLNLPVGRKFINILAKHKLISILNNYNTGNKKYMMLTSKGASYLDGLFRDISRAVTRSHYLENYGSVVHSVLVQKAVLKKIASGRFRQVIWDRNIDFRNSNLECPDALLETNEGNWIALEYERTRKSQNRIYFSLHRHVKGLESQLYSGIYYVFFKNADMLYYQKLFENEKWPVIKRLPKSGKVIVQPGQDFFPSKVENLRGCFIFSHMHFSL